MAYRVSLTAPAEADAYAAFERIREVAPASAAPWLRDLCAAMATLLGVGQKTPLWARISDDHGCC